MSITGSANLSDDNLQADIAGEKVLIELMLCHLSAIGFFNSGFSTLAQMKAKMSPAYYRWLGETLRVLTHYGYVAVHGEEYRMIATCPDKEVAWKNWYAQNHNDSAFEARDKLLRAIFSVFEDILFGKINATEVMFPKGAMTLVEGIYKDNQVAEYFNSVIAEVIAGLINERVKQGTKQAIRVLEVGAGTGGTSGVIFSRLAGLSDHIAQYTYSDISKSFLLHAEKTFSQQAPYIDFNIFNVEHSAATQKIPLNHYDVVVATNVLHATKDIANTLANVKQTMQRGGILLLNEISNNNLFTHLTFGMLEGWWLYDDEHIRIPGSPGLSPSNWEFALQKEGFENVAFPAQASHSLGQQVVVAQSDGLVQVAVEQPAVNEHARTKRASTAKKATHSNDDLASGLRKYLRQLVSKVLKIDLDEIDTADPLESYGIDSILVVAMTDELENAFEDISATLIFEYQSIDAIAEFLLDSQRDAVLALLDDQQTPTEVAVDSEAVQSTPAPIEAATSTPIHIEIPHSQYDENKTIESATRAMSVDDEQTLVAKEIDESDNAIAIIGLNARLPGAKDLDEFWQVLAQGKDCISSIPEQRWPLDDFYQEDKEQALITGKSYSKWGGFISGFDLFDPLLFGVSPREAFNIDPSERLFIRSCWDVLEDANYSLSRIDAQHQKQVGVFAGITRTGFSLYGPQLWKQGERLFPYTSFSSVANRVSYLFDFVGPSQPVDTQCSSSLVAIHQACESLNRGECELAIAGGVNLYVHPSSYILLSAQQMLSVDGKCHSFGSNANGFVPGEGVGTVLLKRMADAQRDKDRIYAVLIGSHVAHGGKTNGYSVPSPSSQGDCIRKAIDNAGISASQISYIEAHGTGTELGDPIEIKGLNNAFSVDTQTKQFCAIGSVKSNIGHLEAAAGIASLAKVVLQLQHAKLAPTLNCDEINPKLNIDKSPFYLQRTLSDWPAVPDSESKYGVRIAGVSSFGASGVNAHLIVQEAPQVLLDTISSPPVKELDNIVLLSAKRFSELKQKAQDLIDHVQAGKLHPKQLSQLAYTTQVGREAMEYRLALKVEDMTELVTHLKTFANSSQIDKEFGFANYIKEHKKQIIKLKDSGAHEHIFDSFVHQGDWRSLLQSWSQGLEVSWYKLWDGTIRSTVPLPAYPYQEERFWLPILKEQSPVVHSNYSPEPELPKEDLVVETLSVDVHKSETDMPHSRFPKVELIAPHRLKLFNVQSSGKPNNVTLSKIDKPKLDHDAPVEDTSHLTLTRPTKQHTVSTLMEELKDSLASLLCMDKAELDEYTSFVELGLDSIIGVEWVRELNIRLSLKLKATVVYDHPTLRDFVAYIEQKTSVQNDLEVVETKHVEAVNVEIKNNAQPNMPVEERGVQRSHIDEFLKTTLAEILYISPSDLCSETSFVELGMDSIVGVEWVRVLNAYFGYNLKATKVYDYPTLSSFGEYLMSLANTTNAQPPVPEAMSAIQNSFSESQLEQELREMLASLLYTSEQEIHSETSFIDLGLDSILGVEWIREINDRYSVKIVATKVYDYPTLTEFTNYLHSQLNLKPSIVKSEGEELSSLLAQLEQGDVEVAQAESLLNALLDEQAEAVC